MIRIKIIPTDDAAESSSTFQNPMKTKRKLKTQVVLVLDLMRTVKGHNKQFSMLNWNTSSLSDNCSWSLFVPACLCYSGPSPPAWQKSLSPELPAALAVSRMFPSSPERSPSGWTWPTLARKQIRLTVGNMMTTAVLFFSEQWNI